MQKRHAGIKGAGLFLFLGLLLGATQLRGQMAPVGEYQLKAVFVLNFAHFVRWPPSALPVGSKPLVIGVLGTDPFGAYLDEAVQGEKIDDHPLIVTRYRRVEDIDACQILFIGQTNDQRLLKILADLHGRSILTVGEMEGFSERGGMVCFVTEKNKIRLKINVGAARSAALTIDSKLLRPAMIVATEKE